MLKTSQAQVAQAANVDVIKIRQMEINYFSSFFSTFGTQCAVVGSMCMCCMSQTPALESEANIFWSWVYWMFNVVGSVCGVFSLVMSLYVVVYAQGLALRGPSGSMVKSVEGMAEEQERIVASFLITIVAATFMCCGIYFINMDLLGAALSSVIMVIGMWYQHHCLLRIYNRFSYTNAEQLWSGEDNDTKRFETVLGVTTDLEDKLLPGSHGGNKQKTSATPVNRVSALLGINKNKSSAAPSPSPSSSPSPSPSQYVSPMHTMGAAGASASSADSPFGAKINGLELFCGYISMQSGGMFKSPWVRRYFVLRGSFALYYKTKLDFELKPAEPINQRAINLSDYVVDVEVTDACYRILLSPGDNEEDRKTWEFRCDTQAELEMWREAFMRATGEIAASGAGSDGVAGRSTVIESKDNTWNASERR